LADGIAQKFAKEYNLDIKIDSAGTGSWHVGNPPCSNSIKVAKQNGVDISKLRARQVCAKDFEEFELIVALDSSNYDDLSHLGAKNLVLLGDFGYDGADVPDPYYFDGFEGFDKVYDMVYVCVRNLFIEKSIAK
jgi:protein-tyrosine phosphatase